MLAPVVLVLDEGADLRARLAPAEVRGARRAGVALELENRGAGQVEVHMADDRSGQVEVSFQPRSLVVPPGSRRTVTGTVTRRRPLFGTARRSPFGVVVATRQRDLRLPGGFTQAPLFSRGVTGLLALLVLLGLWASALVVGLDRIRSGDSDADRRAAAAAAAAAAEEEADGTGGAGSGGGAGGGPGGGGAGAEEGGAEQAAPAGVRVGGTVSAADPEGVDVAIRPVNLSDPEADQAEFAQPLRTFRMADGPPKRYGRSVGVVGQTVDERRSTSTDVDGAWAFGGVRAPGLYLVTFSKPGYQTRRFIVETAEGQEPPALEVDLVAGPGSISGRIVTGGGAGAGGVTVTATDGTLVLTTTSASTGQVGAFALEGLATPATWVLTTSRPGYGAEAARVDLAGSDSASGVVIEVSDGVAAIGGTVTSAEGAVGGLDVTVTDGETTRTATTLTEGPTGGFLIPALPVPGTYTLTVAGEGWQTLTRQVELSADVDLSLEVRRSTAQLVGRIVEQLPDGSVVGIGGVGITLVSEGRTFKSGSAGEGGDGRYELRGIPPGSYVVTLERYGYRTEQILVDLAAGDRRIADVTMVAVPPESLPDTSTVNGVVTATTGGPLAGAGISVRVSTADGSDLVVTATADGAGNYVVENLPPGIHTVTASAAGHAPSSRSVRLAVGGAVTADFSLVPNATVTGRVISNYDGAAKAGAVVRITKPSDPSFGPFDATTAAQPGGAVGFVFSGAQSLESGTYQISVVSLADHRPSVPTTFEVSAPSAAAVDLNVDRLGHLQVQVVRPTAAGLQIVTGSQLTIARTDGTAVCNQIVSGATAGPCPVATQGEVVEVAGLAPGDYRADAGAVAGTLPGSAGPVTVELNRTASLIVVLTQSPGSVSGRVVWLKDGVSTGVPGATVTLATRTAFSFDTFSYVETTCTTTGDATGNFTFDFPAPAGQCAPVAGLVFDFGYPIFGDGRFQASAPGFATNDPTYRNPLDGSVVELRANPGTIGGTVTLADGVASPGTPTGITGTVTTKPTGSGTVAVTVGSTGTISATENGTPTVTAGRYVIAFSKAGYDTETVTVDVAPGGTADASATLDRQGSVTVTAVSRPNPAQPAGASNVQRPVGGVTFTLTPSSGPARQLTAPAGEDHVTFTGVTAGSYTLTGSRAGFDPPVTPLAITVGIGQDRSDTIVLRRYGSISGRLVGVTGDGSSPLVGVTVTAEGPDAATTRFSDVTGPDGSFAIEGLLNGSYDLSTTGVTGWQDLSRTGVVVANADDAALGDVTVNATLASLSGTIVDDATGDGISGATVRIYRDVSGSRVEATTTTDGDGDYSFTGVVPAIWQVEITATGYASVRTAVDLVSNRNFTLDEDLARLRNSVVGDVVARFGTKDLALEGASVVATDIASGTAAPAVPTGADGKYRIDGLLDGSYSISITKDGFTTATATVDLSGGVTRRADGVLPALRRSVAVTVTSAVGDAPISGVAVTLVAATGPTDTGANVGPSNTSGTGVASFSDVLPGAYTVQVAAGGGHLSGSTSLTVPISSSGATVTAAVEVAEARLAGTVTYDDGTSGGPQPSDGAVVQVFAGPGADPATAPVLRTLTVTSGSYSAYVAAGTYTLRIAQGGAEAVGDVTLAVGEIDGLDAALAEPGSITASVEDDEGDPVATATVTVSSGVTIVATLTSGAGGTYAFADIPPGSYTVTATGLGDTDSDTVVVTAGAEATVDLVLVPPPPEP
ncbi:MAG: beta strand repeat-containing protein [Acidimicrobiia bacterium]